MDEETRLAIEALKDHFHLVIDANERRWQTVEASHEKALQVAAESNDKRFAALNGFREAMADQSSRFCTREEANGNKDALLEKLESYKAALENKVDAECNPIKARLEEVGRPNWALMTSMASAAFLVVAAVWMIIGLKIDATVAPMGLELTQIRTAQATTQDRIATLSTLTTASTAEDISSKTDRQQINLRLHTLEDANAQRRTDYSVVNARMVEVETQFCARDSISNLMHANDLRVIAMLWHKAFPDSIYPTDNVYYPKVCNQNVVAPGTGDTAR